MISRSNYFSAPLALLEQLVIGAVGFGVAIGFTSWYLYRLLKDVLASAVKNLFASLTRRARK